MSPMRMAWKATAPIFPSARLKSSALLEPFDNFYQRIEERTFPPCINLKEHRLAPAGCYGRKEQVLPISNKRHCLLKAGNGKYYMEVGTLPFEAELFGDKGGI